MVIEMKYYLKLLYLLIYIRVSDSYSQIKCWVNLSKFNRLITMEYNQL